MNENLNNNPELLEEASIDFGKLFKDLLKHKKLYYKVLSITFVIVVILLLSLPNYYKCEVKLASEMGGGGKSGLAGLASSFGVNIGGAQSGADAINPTFYPDLMNSVDFKTSLFEIPVTIEGDKEAGEADRTMSYYDYLTNEQKKPWWSAAIGGTLRWLKSLIKEQEPPKDGIDPFRLTKQQTDIVKLIDNKVVCDVDQKTMLISIEVTDQNALICATMADSVKTRLQTFITDYRTSKSRVDLEYYKKLSGEAKAKYEEARNRYTAYADSHRNVSSKNAQSKEADLQNEMQMLQQIFQQVVAQLHQAEMKVQQETPAFTTLQSATVPVQKAGPARAKWLVIWLFLAFLATTVWVLHKEDDLKPLLGLD